MWNPPAPQLPKHGSSVETLNSSLNGLMRDVDTFISELEEPNKSTTPPTRAQSLQQPTRQSPRMTYRSNTTYRPAYNYNGGETDIRPSQQSTSSSFSSGNNVLYDYPTTPYHHQPPLSVRPSLTTTTTSATLVEPGFLAMPTPRPYNPTATTKSPYYASHNEPPMYPSDDYYHTDYVNTYLTNNARKQQQQQQDKVYYETPSRSSSLISSSATTINRSSNHSSINRNSSTKSIINTHQLQPMLDSKHSSISSAATTTSTATTPPATDATNTPTTAATPEYAYMSVLSKAFMRRVRGLENVRELFCANEYPESFTGQEAIKMLGNLLDGIPEAYCILIANALMKSKPPLFDPIHYSQKSIIQGAVFNSPDEYYTLQEDITDTEVPTGLLTSLLECYTYNCLPGKGGCYAPCCPNKPDIFALEFNVEDATLAKSRPHADQLPSSSDIAIVSSTNPQMAWAQRVPKELLETLSKREIARQEAVNEMIYSEEVYKNDLDTLSDVIVKPLLGKSTIMGSSTKRDQFVKEVFSNYKALNEVSTALFEDLLDLQHQHENECVPMIGDILIKHFAYFEDPFTQYCPRVSLAEYLVKVEERVNPDFERFIVQIEKSKKMRRLAFRHFLLNPVTRMQRYPLLLGAILKKTDEDHPDYTYLSKCLDMVKKVASKSDALAALFKKRVEILEINDVITFKQGEFQDLQLTDPHRRLYYQGNIKRRSGGIEMTEKSDIHVFIFDHMVLMTKPRKSTSSAGHTTEEYRVWRRPIPLQMLHIENITESAAQLSSASSTSRTLRSTTSTSHHHHHHGSSTSAYIGWVSLTLHHLGQRGGIYPFICSPDDKAKWLAALDEAKASLKKRLGEDVYDCITLDDTTFRYFAAPNGSVKHGKINCTVPFVTKHDERKLAVGTDNGIYFKSLANITTPIKKALSIENVTEMAVLEKHHILLVLTDKTLKAYPLDVLNSPPDTKKAPERLGQELGQHVNFFQVGCCNNKDLVVFKKKKNTTSIFTCLEPIYDLRDPKNQKYITQKTGFMMSSRSNHSWFKKYKEFYVGAEASNVHFLKSKLLIVCERGFEIIDPENLSVGGRDIPDKDDPQFNFVHRQADAIKPLAMYRVHDKFLLCYSKFTFFVNNRNGSLVQRGPQKSPLLCQWEGNPEHIVYQHPYIVAFDPHFIEVRHVDSGDLVQIIPGDQIRLTYFHTTGDTTVIQGCMTHSQRPDIQNVFYLKLNPQRSSSTRSKFR